MVPGWHVIEDTRVALGVEDTAEMDTSLDKKRLILILVLVGKDTTLWRVIVALVSGLLT